MNNQLISPTGRILRISVHVLLLLLLFYTSCFADDLQDIRKRGTLRHLGTQYAHFIKKGKKGYVGLDVEVMRLFAKHLGVQYRFIETTWDTLFTDLTGRKMIGNTNEFAAEPSEPVKGDIIANGLTVLPWREKVVNYSVPTFPTGVWVITRAKSPLTPIKPSGNISRDISNVKTLLKNHSILTVSHTCLDAKSFNFDSAVNVVPYTGNNPLDNLIPTVLKGTIDATLLDIPDALISLQKYPGEIIILGPVTEGQIMGAAVAKSSSNLLKAFNEFFTQIWRDGTYHALVEKYYPSVFLYFEDFFNKKMPIMSHSSKQLSYN